MHACFHKGFHTQPDIILIFALLRHANMKCHAVYQSQYKNSHALTYRPTYNYITVRRRRRQSNSASDYLTSPQSRLPAASKYRLLTKVVDI
jgi:hypothetical protein